MADENYRLLKLTSGETIIASVRFATDEKKVLILKTPCIVEVDMETASIEMWPWMVRPAGDATTLPVRHVMSITAPSEELMDYYNRTKAMIQENRRRQQEAKTFRQRLEDSSKESGVPPEQIMQEYNNMCAGNCTIH